MTQVKILPLFWAKVHPGKSMPGFTALPGGSSGVKINKLLVY
jgi:hypothetical protein